MLSEWRALQKAWKDPGADGVNLRFEHFPVFHLMTLAGLARASVSRECLEPAGLSVADWRILTVIESAESVPFAHIADATQMDKGQLSRTLRAAQAKGLLRMEVVPLDRRSADTAVSSIGRVTVRISPLGQKLHDEVLPVARLSQLRLVEMMSVDQRLTVADIARRFEQHLAAELAAPS